MEQPVNGKLSLHRLHQLNEHLKHIERDVEQTTKNRFNPYGDPRDRDCRRAKASENLHDPRIRQRKQTNQEDGKEQEQQLHGEKKSRDRDLREHSHSPVVVAPVIKKEVTPPPRAPSEPKDEWQPAGSEWERRPSPLYPPPAPQPRLTHPDELIIRPDELDFRLPPFEARPLAQHLVVPVTGFYCRLCARFFPRQSDEIEHCSSREHYERIRHEIAPPPPPPNIGQHHDHYRRHHRRNEFIMATLDKYHDLRTQNIYDNLERRGMHSAEGQRPQLLNELGKLLRLESQHHEAVGYFSLHVEECPLPNGAKQKWFAEFELREIISQLPDVINVIDSNKTALCSPMDTESKGHLWMFSVLMRRPFPEAGLQIEAQKLRGFQNQPLFVRLGKKMLNLTAFKRDQPVEETPVPKNYIEI